MSVERRVIAPWPGDEHLAFLQGGVEVNAGRTLYLSGQASNDGSNVIHAGDLLAQVMMALDKIQTALDLAAYHWTDVVRLNWYVRADHLEQFFRIAHAPLKERLDSVGCRAPGVLLGVAALALPEMLCEFEATAVR